MAEHDRLLQQNYCIFYIIHLASTLCIDLVTDGDALKVFIINYMLKLFQVEI